MLHPLSIVISKNDRCSKHEKVNSCEFLEGNDDATIANLAQELPLYLAASDGATVTCEDDKLTWWANHKDTLPHWSSLVRKLLLIQPSSASAERVFSLLTNAFGSQQESALQYYLETKIQRKFLRQISYCGIVIAFKKFA